MIGISRMIQPRTSFSALLAHGFTLPAVPTGMKMGVHLPMIGGDGARLAAEMPSSVARNRNCKLAIYFDTIT